MRQLNMFAKSLRSEVGGTKEGYLPLRDSFLSAYLAAVLERKKADLDAYVEFSAMCHVARYQGFITQSQCINYTYKFRAREYLPEFQEDSLYIRLLHRLYIMVYTECIESADLWRALACEIDAAKPRLSPQEYRSLCNKLEEHEVEVENAVYNKHAVRDKFGWNVHRADYVSFDSLRNEAIEIEKLSPMVTHRAREFLYHKVRSATGCGIITAGEQLEILAQVRLC